MALKSNRRVKNSAGGGNICPWSEANQQQGCVFVEFAGCTAESADRRRFSRFHWIALAAAAVLGMAAGGASAQNRQFPADARYGNLEIPAFPAARLDGNPVSLAPGTVVRNEANAQVLPQQLSGVRPVIYRVDFLGQIREIWILDESEATRIRQSGRINDGGTTR